MSQKRIGILTSGGDCAGLNAVIRAVVHRAIEGFGCQVIGIHDGTHGLMDRPIRSEELSLRLFSGTILRLGGTILGTTNKGDPFAFPMPDGTTKDRSGEFVDGFRELGLDGLIGVGGDGSLDILNRLCAQGDIPFIGVPKTIDNDVPLTEFSVGFSTAVSTAVEALDRLQPTAASHDRVMILEVMGRDAGHIALNAGIGGGADVILIPEIPYDIETVTAKLKSLWALGRKHALVVCSEAAKPIGGEAEGEAVTDGNFRYGGSGDVLGEQISGLMDVETRVTTLGHIQRGGTPTSYDRLIASAFGVRAVDLMLSGASGKMVAWQHRQVVEVDLADVTSRSRSVDMSDTLISTARGLGICLGDETP